MLQSKNRFLESCPSPETQGDVHGSSSCALLANLVPTVNWRACMKRSKSRLPGGQGFTVNGIKDKATPQSPVLSRPVSFVPAELFQKMPQQEQGQEQSQGDQQRQNRQEIQLPRPLDPPACSFGESKPSSAPDADISAHGARLGAPSPRSEHTCGPSRSFVATIFDPDRGETAKARNIKKWLLDLLGRLL